MADISSATLYVENTALIPRTRGKCSFVYRDIRWQDTRARTPHPDGVAIFLTHPKAPGVELVVEFDGQYRTVALQVRTPLDGASSTPTPVPPGGLTATLMRDVPWFEVEVAARYFARMGLLLDQATASSTWERYDENDQVVESGPSYPFLDYEEATRRAALTKPPKVKSGRPPLHTDLFLAKIAARYVELLDQSPVTTIAEEEDYSQSHVSNLIRECRARGLLTKDPARRGVKGGRAYGELTDEARRILRQS